MKNININFNKTPDNIFFSIKTLINNGISDMYLFNYSAYTIGLPLYTKIFELHKMINEFNDLHKKFKIKPSKDKYHYILKIYRILY